LVSLVSQWKEALALLVASADCSRCDRLAAGAVYELVGLSRFKRERCTKDTALVAIFMESLGWHYREHHTRPYFIKRKPEPFIILKQVSNETVNNGAEQ